jgi:FAD-dependent urate hydroxylase
VEKVVAYSRRIGNSKTTGPIARRFRDLVMPLALKHLASSNSHTWPYACHVGWDEKVPA